MEGQTEDLGLDEYFRSDGVSVIEWAERAGDELPANTIKVRIIHGDDNIRNIELEGLEL